ncbi:uncharacterized protein DUF4446 [Natranaerovirga pectinivora]|uniref:Uncharacterized protein DUF4446 n=1 Tax=Natranaerovirga pectinivora TaxID=682400 RepID=A0A4R3MFH2_9FIRM|nr:DUF4446 family protein [Natranaerovirga pectinivora]TCT12258.1 uncharacterized protein DUF4446 [Natranaerovirga pectinivora]
MDQLEYYIEYYNIYIVCGMIIAVILLFIIALIQQIKISNFRKKYNLFMKSGEVDIEKLLISQINKIEGVENHLTKIDKNQILLDKRIDSTYQKIGIVKYNAFKEMGGNLSFAIVLLNYYNNGVLINGIHSRDGSYTYVKTIENGKTSVQLSPEENEALDKAIRQ